MSIRREAMRETKMKKAISMSKLLPVVILTMAWLFTATAYASAPGITGPTFNLTAAPAYLTQPDGQAVYSWGYGCNGAPTGYAPAAINTGFCNPMQVPGPTLIVTEGATVSVTLTNNLPTAAGNTSILFPGFTVTTSGGVTGLLTQEAAPGGTVTYTFTASSPGTRAYYSGTQGDLQVEMGLYGAIIVLPSAIPSNCTSGLAAATPGCSLNVPTEPSHPEYFLINGRSMPDDMDPNYAFQYPHQPYNGNPHMHPGEQVLIRVIGQGRWQHPFHEHGNHVRILGRDGNLILSATDANSLAGPLQFTTTTTPGLAFDGIFYWTAKGMNWDAYGHNPASTDSSAKLSCTPDANGYNTSAPTAINYFEWCQDHNKPMQVAPFGDVAGGGPVTLPDANIFANGAWFGGSPYLGPDATVRATGPTGTTPPSGTIANSPTGEAGFAFMWHSHNEREITTNNIFPGGMLMMMLVDSREFVIDESQ